MPRQMPQPFEIAVAQHVHQEARRRGKALAEMLGPLPDSVQLTKREADSRWQLRTDKVPPEAAPQLAREALTMLTEQYASEGRPLPQGERLALLVAAKVNAVLYPYRRKLVATGTPEPEEQVRVAGQYRRRAGDGDAVMAESVPSTPAPLGAQEQPLLGMGADAPAPLTPPAAPTTTTTTDGVPAAVAALVQQGAA